MAAKKDEHVIVGIHVTDRLKKAGAVQEVLTSFGCSIKTRIGLHEVSEDFCSPRGVILLEIFGGSAVADRMCGKLKKIKGIDVQTMVFSHR